MGDPWTMLKAALIRWKTELSYPLGRKLTYCAYIRHGHTKGHISYYVTSKEEEDPAVFTGDTLFIAGCGRFFEGTAEQMYQSLCVTLGSLPKSTRVYCGHEYTVKSLQFMLTVEPENEKMKQKLEWAQKQREANQPTVPSTIGDELEINTFMRVDLPEIQAKFGAKSAVEALRTVRNIKDTWKGDFDFTVNGWAEEAANWLKPSRLRGNLGGANGPKVAAGSPASLVCGASVMVTFASLAALVTLELSSEAV
uniref:Hydroxyacylglutathione hydrolase C-terminal domain-containing protein n=1 Tax=Aegilops tauschii subsp. strangulata TaxID=200361 RepID=A0A453I5X6_AEGTS